MIGSAITMQIAPSTAITISETLARQTASVPTAKHSFCVRSRESPWKIDAKKPSANGVATKSPNP